MKINSLCLASTIAVALCLTLPTDGSLVKSSSDELLLKFQSHLSTPKLMGLPGTMHQLQFELTNNGNNANFQLSQKFTDGFEGQLVPGQTISLPSKTSKSITLINLVVPQVELGTILQLTLTAAKDLAVGGKMQEVSITVNFLVGAPQEFVDSDKPSVETKYPGARCQVERNDTLCSNSRWQIEYLVKDASSGLKFIEVSTTGKDYITSPVSYSMPNFAIGTRDEVEVSVDASCCAAGISIRAVDVHDNEANVDSLRDANGSSILSSSFLLTVIVSLTLFTNSLV